MSRLRRNLVIASTAFLLFCGSSMPVLAQTSSDPVTDASTSQAVSPVTAETPPAATTAAAATTADEVESTTSAADTSDDALTTEADADSWSVSAVQVDSTTKVLLRTVGTPSADSVTIECVRSWQGSKVGSVTQTYSISQLSAGVTADLSGYGTVSWTATFKSSGKTVNVQKGSLDLVASLPDGISSGRTYYLANSIGSLKVIDIANGSHADGGNAWSFAANSSNAQRFKVTFDDHGLAKFTCIGSGKVLDVAAGSSKAGTNVQQWSDNGSLAQRWVIIKHDDGTYAIQSALSSGIVLEVSGASLANGANVQVWTNNGTAAQKWWVVDVSPQVSSSGQASIADGYYTLTSSSTHKALSMEWGQTSANLGTATASGSSKECFKIVRLKDGFYQVIAAETGLALDLAGGSRIPYTPTRGWSNNESAGQKWAITGSATSGYVLTNVSGGLALGVVSGGTAGLVPNGSAAVKWSITASTSPSDLTDSIASKNIDGSVLSAGTYVVQSVLSQSRMLEVANGSTANGGNVRSFDANMTQAQMWKVTIDSKGYVTLSNVKSGKVLDVAGAVRGSGTNVQQYSSNGSDAQKWAVRKNSDGSLTLVSKLDSSLVMEIAGGSTANGANVQIWNSNGSKAQCWRFWTTSPQGQASEGRTVADGTYTLTDGNGLVLDVPGASTSNGTQLQTYGANGTIAQAWYVKLGTDGYYRIRSLATGKGMDVRAGGVYAGTPVQQWGYSASYVNQRWVIHKNSDGTYRLIPAGNAALGVSSTGTAGGKLSLQLAASGSKQDWKMTAVSSLTIAEGCYRIRTACGNNEVLDLPASTWSKGSRIQVWSSNDTMAQRWWARRNSDGTYTFQSVSSGYYLSESNGKVSQQDRSGAHTNWKISYVLGTGYSLINAATGHALDLQGANASNGVTVQGYASNQTKAQAWSLESASPVPEGFYELSPVCAAGSRLDINGGSMSNGANAQIWAANGGGLAQRYWIRSAGNGWYTLTTCCGAKRLDVDTRGGSNVQQWSATGGSSQKWRFAMGEHGLELVSALNGHVLDVSGAGSGNGTNVDVYSYNGSSAQAWRLVSAATPSKIGYQNPSAFYQVSSWNVRLSQGAGTIFGYASPSRISIDATRDDCVNAFISRARDYVGTTPYVWDYACAPGVGVDCSGLVMQCLYACGMSTDYTPYGHYYDSWQDHNATNMLYDSRFMHVSFSDRRPGDLIFYPGHVGIYVGNDTIINATYPSEGVRYDSVYRFSVIGAARPFV